MSNIDNEKKISENEVTNDTNYPEDLFTPIDSFKFENKEEFDVLIIKPNDIENFDWKDPTYIKNLLDNDIYEIKKIDPNNFIKNVAEYLKIKEKKGDNIITNCIAEEPEYVYEIMYLELPKKDLKYDDLNQMSILLDGNEEMIFGHTIIIKTHVPVNSTNMYCVNITKDDIKNILYTRVNNKIVIYKDDGWVERNCHNIEEYSEDFFEEDKYKIKKLELAFLKHNINIWYTTCEYAEDNVCGKLIKEKIDKCIWFTYSSEKYRGNLTLNEVKKIIKLSNILENYDIDENDSKDEKDSLGRNIVKSKYRILEKKYNENFNLNL